MSAPQWPRVVPNPLVDATCRHCDTHGMIYVELRLEARPVGSFSLSGAQVKVSASGHPYAVCAACGHESRGEVEAAEPAGDLMAALRASIEAVRAGRRANDDPRTT